MAMETEAKIAALLSLLAVLLLLLLHTLLIQPPRLRGPAATLIADLFTLEFDGRRLVELVTRRNMILLCHAILFIILKDAGLLATPARRCAATTSTGTSTASAAAGGGASSMAQPQARMSVVVWQNKAAKNAIIADCRRLERQPRGPRPAKATARCALPWTEAAATEREEAVVQELPLVERSHSSDCFHFDQAAVREIVPVEDKHIDQAAVRETVPVEDKHIDQAAVWEIVPVEDKSSCFYSEQIADDEERNRGEEDMAREETEVECSDDVDEMNKRFEDFIANMRRKMQEESICCS